jgi:hydrogenase maturation protein HypF
MGRLFDAVAALAGLRPKINYEGQAAIELEWLAMESTSDNPYSWSVIENNAFADSSHRQCGSPNWIVDTRPLVRDVAVDVARKMPATVIARRFHSTVVEMIFHICERVRARFGLNKVILSGGVFMNGLLTSESRERLSSAGFSVYCHEQVPANDGGLSLGQLTVASRTMTITACH